MKKLELKELQALTDEQLTKYKAEAEDYKTKLEAKKADTKAWTKAMQDELDAVVLSIVDADDVLEERKAKATKDKTAPVKVKIVRGRRYNPNTGKEESFPYEQTFNYNEWQLFKKHHKGLGYVILEAVEDPYGDAAELVQKFETKK